MKCYLYITRFFPETNSWRGCYCLDFVKALRERMKETSDPFKIFVLMPGRGEDYEIDGVRVYRFAERKLPSSILPMLFSCSNKKSFSAKVRQLLRAEDQMVDSIVIAHANAADCGIYALAAKELNRQCLTLLHHHDLASFGLNLGRLHACWLHNVIQYPIMRRIHESIDCHVFISEASRRSFLSVPNTNWTCYDDYRKQYRGLGVYRSPKIKRSIVLHNGVDVKIFNPKTRTVDANSEIHIGCVSNFQALKGIDYLVMAASKIKSPVKLILVGSGCEEMKIKRLAIKLNVDLEIRHEVRHDLLADFYRSIDLFVLPSFFEGFGCVYTEAASCGVPFIACKGQGIEDVIPPEDRQLWLAKPKDADDLADKIEYWIKHHPKQKFASPIDIKQLVSNFWEELKGL